MGTIQAHDLVLGKRTGPRPRRESPLRLVQDLQPSLAASNIRAEYIPMYYTPLPAYAPILEVTIEVLKVALGIVLGAVLKTLVERWLTIPNLVIMIRDQAGNQWTFQVTARQVKVRLDSIHGSAQCMGCHSFVPRGNFCDICGRSLFQ